MPTSGKINKIFFVKLQIFSIKILNNYPTWTSSLCMHLSIDDLQQGDFHNKTVIIHISLSSIVLKSIFF